MTFEWKHKYNITKKDGSPIDWDDEGTGVCAGVLKLSKKVDIRKLLYDLNNNFDGWIGKELTWKDIFPVLVECELED